MVTKVPVPLLHGVAYLRIIHPRIVPRPNRLGVPPLGGKELVDFVSRIARDTVCLCAEQSDSLKLGGVSGLGGAGHEGFELVDVAGFGDEVVGRVGFRRWAGDDGMRRRRAERVPSGMRCSGVSWGSARGEVVSFGTPRSQTRL